MRYSIGIPAYKGKFLFKCIESILKQDYTDFELIIVNDASPEDLDSIVNKFDDHRIRYFKNEKNFGAEHVVDNWNVCLSHAVGEYFVLMGDDDEMMADYLSSFDKLINNYPNLDIFHCRSYVINEDSDIIRITPSWPQYESVYENIWHRMNKLRSQYISDFVYKRETLLKKGGFYKLQMAWASDDISSFEASIEKGIAHTQKPLLCYRESTITLSNSGGIDLKLNAINCEEQWYESFLKMNKPDHIIDLCFFNNIKKEKNKYFLSKRIETIAYNGIRPNHLLWDFISFCRKRKLYHLNFKHMIYVLILSIKKDKAASS